MSDKFYCGLMKSVASSISSRFSYFFNFLDLIWMQQSDACKKLKKLQGPPPPQAPKNLRLYSCLQNDAEHLQVRPTVSKATSQYITKAIAFESFCAISDAAKEFHKKKKKSFNTSKK